MPVGQDQKQHIEITRDIANRFNNIYGEIFVEPVPDIEKTSKLIPGIDGQKMSKSYGNTIPIFGEEKQIRKKFMSIVTDSTDIDKPKNEKPKNGKPRTVSTSCRSAVTGFPPLRPPNGKT